MSSIKHLREEFRPPEWLIGTIPRKAPYVPQIGDKVMYFRQGHEAYLRTVERRQIYDLGHSFHLPWVKNANLRVSVGMFSVVLCGYCFVVSSAVSVSVLPLLFVCM